MSSENSNIFVHGTLLKGGALHGAIKHCHFVCNAQTTSEYLVTEAGYPQIFPYTKVPIQNDQFYGTISGEIYSVDPQTEQNLDKIEGIPHLFYKELIECMSNTYDSILTNIYITNPKHFNPLYLLLPNDNGKHNWAKRKNYA